MTTMTMTVLTTRIVALVLMSTERAGWEHELIPRSSLAPFQFQKPIFANLVLPTCSDEALNLDFSQPGEWIRSYVSEAKSWELS